MPLTLGGLTINSANSDVNVGVAPTDIFVGKYYIYVQAYCMATIKQYAKNTDGTIGAFIRQVSWQAQDASINSICRNDSSVPGAYAMYTEAGYDYLVGWSMDAAQLITWIVDSGTGLIVPNSKTTYSVCSSVCGGYGRGGWNGGRYVYFMNRTGFGVYRWDLSNKNSAMSQIGTVLSGAQALDSSYTGSGMFVNVYKNEVYWGSGANESDGLLGGFNYSTATALSGSPITGANLATLGITQLSGAMGCIILSAAHPTVGYYICTNSTIVRQLNININLPVKPLSSVFTPTTFNQGWDNLAFGYAFVPNKNISVNTLGGCFNGTKTVKLYSSDYSEIASVSVTSANTFTYSDITPVKLYAGVEYYVAIGTGGTNTISYGSLSMPLNLTDLTIINHQYGATFSKDNTVYTDAMQGCADIQYTVGHVADIPVAPTVPSNGNCGFAWTSTITNPTISINYQSGDYLVVNQMSSGAASTPTGFTNVYNNGSGGLQLSYLRFNSSGTSYTITCSYTGAITWALVRGADSIKSTGTSTSGATITSAGSNQLIMSTTGNSATQFSTAGWTRVNTVTWPIQDYYTLAHKIFTNSVVIPVHNAWAGTDNYIIFAPPAMSIYINTPTVVAGGFITSTLRDTKIDIQENILRRRGLGDVSAQYNTSLFTNPIMPNQVILPEHFMQIRADIGKITAYSASNSSGSIVTAATVNDIRAKVAAVTAYDITSTTATDCTSSCTGGCYTGCYSGCTSCTGTCSSTCTGTCNATCTTSCASDCTGTCTGAK